MSFSKSFLVSLAKEKQLAEREQAVFVALFGEGKSRPEIAEQLHVQESAVSTCLSGVYKKFGILGKGPNKESRLKDKLVSWEKVWRTQQSNQYPSTSPPQLDETLIEQVQERCSQKILEQHSRMRLLSGKTVGVDQLYVDVYLLDKPEHYYANSDESLLKNHDLKNDRLALGKRYQRNQGFEIANQHTKLFIVGKPGSGKTTFLKHLAVDWCRGKFQPEKIALLLELRRIRESKWNFIDAIGKEVGTEKQQVLTFLEQGHLLVLLDGLDEISTDELRRNIKEQLREVSEKYPQNRFILTCRTQITGSVSDDFQPVEMADFSLTQVKQFVHNWFIASGDSETRALEQWEKINYAAANQPDFKELTATPVLLSLICWVLQDEGTLPTNRVRLYKKGTTLMLRRWNDKKEIESWEFGPDSYRRLSLEDKEALLIDIAARKFENPKNFVLFEQDELAKQIMQKLRLANIQEGVTVLKAIEAQHGLLIERADELWSFSHLTFQEYFTVQGLTQLSFQQLAKKISSKHWQEVVEQLVKSQQPADRLLRLIKQAIDLSITQEPIIQTFLGCLLQKSISIQDTHKPVEVRSWYFVLTFELLSSKYALNRVLDIELALALNRICTVDLNFIFNFDLSVALNLDPTFALDFYLLLTLTLVCACALDRAFDSTCGTFIRSLNYTRSINCKHIISLDLIACLHQLEDELPVPNRSEKLQQWWILNGTQWIEQLRQVMIQYRNIGYDWQFTDKQEKQLQCYYDANKFLVGLMQVEGAVTEECRAEIEDGLLLPWAELQSLYPQTYGELEEF